MKGRFPQKTRILFVFLFMFLFGMIDSIYANGGWFGSYKSLRYPQTTDGGQSSKPAETTLPSDPRIKSPGRAFATSLSCTILSLPTVIFTIPGLIAGPSTGYFYGGLPRKAWRGIFIRTAAAGGIVAAFAVQGDDATEPVVIACGAILLGSIIHDLGDVSGAVRENNERIKKYAWAVSPFCRENNKTRGLSFVISF